MIEQQIKQYRALNEWFQSPAGLFVANEFSQQLELVNQYLRGDTLLQLGNCGDNSWLSKFNFNHKWIASPFIADKIDLYCSLNQIPIKRNSLDCILAPLTIEPFGASFNLFDEIDRVLKPMGFVVFLSLNPWSLWGCAMKCGLLHCFADHKVKMRTPFNLNRIFLNRGYRQCSLNNFCYIPPFSSEPLIKKFLFLNEVGKMLSPFPSGFYCYIAQKYQFIEPAPTLESLEKSLPKEYQSPLSPAIN